MVWQKQKANKSKLIKLLLFTKLKKFMKQYLRKYCAFIYQSLHFQYLQLAEGSCCPPPLLTYFCLFFLFCPWQIEWFPHIQCVSLFNNVSFASTDLWSLGTLISEVSCYVVLTIRCQVNWRFQAEEMHFASSLIWYHPHKNTQAHCTCRDQ